MDGTYNHAEAAEHNFAPWQVLVFGNVVTRKWTRESAEKCADFYAQKNRPAEVRYAGTGTTA
jgi:hypothetical protein